MRLDFRDMTFQGATRSGHSWFNSFWNFQPWGFIFSSRMRSWPVTIFLPPVSSIHTCFQDLPRLRQVLNYSILIFCTLLRYLWLFPYISPTLPPYTSSPYHAKPSPFPVSTWSKPTRSLFPTPMTQQFFCSISSVSIVGLSAINGRYKVVCIFHIVCHINSCIVEHDFYDYPQEQLSLNFTSQAFRFCALNFPSSPRGASADSPTPPPASEVSAAW